MLTKWSALKSIKHLLNVINMLLSEWSIDYCDSGQHVRNGGLLDQPWIVELGCKHQNEVHVLEERVVLFEYLTLL